MDDNTMRLVEKIIAMQVEITELKTLKAAMIDLLWSAELKDAQEYKKYGGKYNESIASTQIKVAAIRNIYGIMPNPEAVAIYKEVEATKEDEDEESGE